jgi:hypothetical protein
MRQHIDPLAALLAPCDGFDQRQAVLADGLVDGDIFLGDFAGALIGGSGAPISD